MRNVFLIATAIVFWSSIAPVRAFDSVYSMTNPSAPNCRRLPDGASWRCRGPAGYYALFSDEGNVVEVAYGLRNNEKSLGGLQWRGGDDPFGRVVEWRLAGRVPFAAILRINALDENDRGEQLLLIARVAADGSCRIAAIDARQPNANVRARQIADRAGPAHVCGQ